MKVLAVNHLLDPAVGGGTAERTFQMSRHLAAAGISCSVLTTDIGLSKARLDGLAGVAVFAYPSLWRRHFIPRLSWSELKRHVAAADVVHLMGHWTLLNAFAYLAARQLRKPYVVCPAGALRIYGRSKLLKRLYNALVGKRLLREARACIAVTAAERGDFERYGVAADKIVVIPNAISAESVPPPATEAFRKRHRLVAPYVLFMGRLNRIKGPDLLLEAFCGLKDRCARHHLVFAGPDEGMRAGLEEMAATHGISERVHFLGFVGGEEKYQAYYAADLLAIPSRQEAMSIVVLEAGITATPVILTDQCGFEDVGNGGQVVKANAKALEAGLAHMLDDPSRLAAMGRDLRQHVLERFGWPSVLELYLALFRRVTDATGAAPASARRSDRAAT